MPLLCIPLQSPTCVFFFFNDTATTEIYTLSLHDALPISDLVLGGGAHADHPGQGIGEPAGRALGHGDRKSTRLNSSHVRISYAVFCLKKKKKKITYNYTVCRILLCLVD